VQEALRNVAAHARAEHVTVDLHGVDGAYELLVADDGRGFAPEVRERRRLEGHLGLSLVEELARQAGGSLTVDSSNGAGTRVRLEVPVR
jgi:signal transduction histidine kinase